MNEVLILEVIKMVKRNFKMMAALVAVSLGTGFATVHAAAPTNNEPANNPTKIEHEMHKDRKDGANPICYVLENKLGFTKDQIKDAEKSGKTAFDLAGEKGVAPDQLRSMIVDAHSEKLDQMVSAGKITQDKADAMKSDFKDRIQKWDGSFRHKNRKEKSN